MGRNRQRSEGLNCGMIRMDWMIRMDVYGGE